MKKIFYFFILCTSVSVAQDNSLPDHQKEFRKINPLNTTASYLYPSKAIIYTWDTISGSWEYKFNEYFQYISDTLQVSLNRIDTVNNVPVLFDTTVYDNLGRMVMNYYQYWTGSWDNGSKIEQAYWDSTTRNYSRRNYEGSGTNWILSTGDSTYTITDVNGNIIEKYVDYLDTALNQFELTTHLLMDYDLMNRMIKKRYFQYDNQQLQYFQYGLDSNYTYDLLFTQEVTSSTFYSVYAGLPTPYIRQSATYTGTTVNDKIFLTEIYNTNTQSWENSSRLTSAGGPCGISDSTLHELSLNSSWVPTGGTKYILHPIDSCDFDEIVIQDYVPWLGAYRNNTRIVYIQILSGIFAGETQHGTSILYPNPIHSSATLKLEGMNLNSELQLKIYNALGEEIVNRNYSGTNEITIEKENLGEGIFFYQVSGKGLEKLSGKFIVE